MTSQTLPAPPLRVEARERLIVALDFSSAAPTYAFLDALRQRRVSPKWIKIGLQLFSAEGPAMVHTLREQGYSIFLDLKLHDIPNTVASAIRALGPLEIDLLTVHAAGGPAMLEAAAHAAASVSHPPRLLAVTVLTSMDAAQLAAIGITAAPQDQALRLASLAFQRGIDGVVASPLEAALLRSELGPSLHLVTPGIRPGASADDQRRTAAPAEAIRAGASQLVVGRPITHAEDPASAIAGMLAEIDAALV